MKKAIEWKVRPSPLAAAGVAALIFVLPAMIYVSYGDPWLSLVAFLILAASLRSFLLPTRYSLDEEGVTSSCFPAKIRRPWEVFEGFQVGGQSIRLNGRRDMDLKLGENRVHVVDYIRKRLGRG